jgi:hypothetical protein
MPTESPFPPNFRTVQDLLEEFYGLPFVTSPRESDYTIGTTAAAIGANAGQRVGGLISNTGSTNFAISFLRTVTITTGILLLPGGSLTLDWYYDGDLLTRQLYAIADNAGGTLHMVERYIEGA